MDATTFIGFNSRHASRPISLDLDEIYHIGRQAFAEGKTALTKQWMLLALEKFTNETREQRVRTRYLRRNIDYYIDIRDHLAYADFKVSLPSTILLVKVAVRGDLLGGVLSGIFSENFPYSF